MNSNLINNLSTKSSNVPDKPILLFKENDHSVYWMGHPDNNAFRTNIYLIVDGNECIIVDPGSRSYFPKLKDHIVELELFDKVTGMILCHQDPDVAASMKDWVNIKPEIKVITSPRTNVLLPHYGQDNYDFYAIDKTNGHKFSFESGNTLKFIEAPFMHFAGAFATYDPISKFLFSGDICAAIDIDNQFIVTDFDSHKLKLDLFHLDYIASNIASRGFAKKLHNYDIEAILPQHGAIIPEKFISETITYLEELICGLDIIYVNEK